MAIFPGEPGLASF